MMLVEQCHPRAIGYQVASGMGFHQSGPMKPSHDTLCTEADRLVDEIHGFEELHQGWDGESAEPPSSASIRDAARFARTLAALVPDVHASLHVDGTVILEAMAGDASLSFQGDGSVIYAISGSDPGREMFDGAHVPPRIMVLLGLPATA